VFEDLRTDHLRVRTFELPPNMLWSDIPRPAVSGDGDQDEESCGGLDRLQGIADRERDDFVRGEAWVVYRCALAEADQACGILLVDSKPNNQTWIVSDTNREECQHGMKLDDALHIMELHNTSIQTASAVVPKSAVVDQPRPAARPDLAPVWERVVADVRKRYPRANPFLQSEEIIELVVSDMRERDRVGRERYGMPLTAHNGRDQLVDLYQELLDAAVYARAGMLEGNFGVAAVYHNTLDSVFLVREMIDVRDSRKAGA
jgi:hypothetical protein